MNVCNRLLSKLVSNTENSRFTLISDDLDSNCNNLLQCFVDKRSRFVDNKIALFLFERQSFNRFQPILKNSNNVILYDYITKDSNELQLKSIMKALSMNETIVVMDSLSALIIVDNNWREFCETLTLLSNKCQLVCCLHRDSHSQYIVSSIEYLAQTVIKVTANKKQNCFEADVRHRKSSRKSLWSLNRSCELFTTKGFDLIEMKTTEERNTAMNANTSHEIIANLRFNLNLKDNEIEAKNNLMLPYIKTHNESKVYYEYDRFDDIDDEDPDEDLDI